MTPERKRPPRARAAEPNTSLTGDTHTIADTGADRWAEHCLEQGWHQLEINTSSNCRNCGTITPDPACNDCGVAR